MPVPQLTNGPYSQLLASRTWATGFSAVGVAIVAPLPEVWAAAMLVPAAAALLIKTKTKSFAIRINVLPFP
jgi:hypothetical protein